MANDEPLRGRLVMRLNELVGRAGRIGADLRMPGDRDWTERANEIENDEVLEGLDTMTRAEVAQVRQAIARIDSGTYGQCVRCGVDIEPARLSALPTAATCASCAAITVH